MPTKTKTKLPVIYTSIREGEETLRPRPRDMRLVRYPAPDLRDAMGGLSGAGAELVYEFNAGLLVVNDLLVERDREFLAERARMLHQDFDPSEYTAEDIIEWLEGHEDFGVTFFRQPEMAPPAGPLLEEITGAAIDGDLDRLVEIHEEEDSTWARDEVLAPVRAAITRLEARAAESASKAPGGNSKGSAAAAPEKPSTGATQGPVTPE